MQHVRGASLRAQLTEAGAQHVEHAQLLVREVGDVKVQVEVHDAVRVARDVQRPDAIDLARLRLHRGDRLRHILKAQVRQAHERLRAVLALLPLLHPPEGRIRLAALIGIPRGGGGGEPLGLAAGVILPLRERRQHIEGAQVAARAEQVGQQALKIACMDLFAQRVEHGGVVDIRQRITAVEPAVKRAAGKLHAVGLGDLAVGEGKALERRRERRAVEPGCEHIARDLRRKGLDLVKGVSGRVAHDERGARLINAVGDLERHVLRKTALEECALERCLIRAGEIVREDLGCIDRLHVVIAAQESGEAHVAERLLAGHRLIVHRGLARAGLLHREVKIRGAVCVLRQVLRVDIGKHALGVHVAVEEDARVRRVVKALVRGDELRIAQLGDVLRLAAARKPVAGVGIQQPVRPLADDALDIGIGALHLAEDDTVVVRLRLLVVKLVVPALLHEDLGLFVDVRAEHAVEIHAHEVEQILLAAAGDREDGLVAVGHGVEEGLH